ncbi:hypothetical protein IQ13_0037 [Lacibacter cauensis]|uniref:Uncharacterized protein n=1 Tax=Lacibacter cauensis TaxID=510947 RepID=A0A562SV05_9BACT|nr:hypothetical protein [Lacibacter cauensis]TWI84884.1 hypothetical protein IQ13_0037 [Lacibacter cauensis]
MLSLVKAGTAKWLKLEVKRAVKIVIAKEMVKPGKENPRRKAQNPRVVRLFETV